MNEQELASLYEALDGTYIDGLYNFTKADVTGSATEAPAPRAVASVLRSVPSSPSSPFPSHYP